MEDMKKSLTDLTGAVNAIVDQLRRVEARMTGIEQNGNVFRSEMLEEVRSVSERLVRVEQGSANNAEVRAEPVALCGPANEQDLKDICRLPDCVRDLQVFEGNPTQYVSWVHSVENILRDFEIVRGKPLYRAILQHIRQKIRGSADTALVSYNVFDESWAEIKRILSLHYADKRDIRTLEHQLHQLTQKGSKLDEFYATVNHQFSLIINKVKTDSHSPETVNALIETYRNRALDVFIRGLSPEMSRMLIIQKPQTLPEAYSACLELQNLSMRNSTLHVSSPNRITVPLNQTNRADPSPPLPPRRNNNQFHRSTFRPHYSNRPQNFNNNYNNRFQNFSQTSRPSGPNVPAAPMEVDSSTQSRQVNYMNRPRSNHFKRKAASDNFAPKQQRLYNLESEETSAPRESENLIEPKYKEGAAKSVTTESENFMEGASPAYQI